jgi:hypothetical protein
LLWIICGLFQWDFPVFDLYIALFHWIICGFSSGIFQFNSGRIKSSESSDTGVFPWLSFQNSVELQVDSLRKNPENSVCFAMTPPVGNLSSGLAIQLPGVCGPISGAGGWYHRLCHLEFSHMWGQVSFYFSSWQLKEDHSISFNTLL